MKHTKGPWIIEYDNDTGPNDEGFWEWYSISSESDFVGKIDTEANARLISCAPQMLETMIKAYKELSALRDCLYGQNISVAGWHLNGDHEPIDNFFESNNENALENLKNIIEKATGMKIEEVLK